MKKAKLLILIAGLVSVLVMAACDAGPPDANPEIAAATNAALTQAAAGAGGGEPDFLIVAPDQTIGSDNLVRLDRVKLADAAYVVIRNDVNGQPGDTVIGYNRLSGGDFTNSSFTIDSGLLADGANTLWAVIHSDLGANAVFEFPGADVPQVNSAGNIAMDSFVATK